MSAVSAIFSTLSAVASLVIPVAALGFLIFLAAQQSVPAKLLESTRQTFTGLFVFAAVLGAIRYFDHAGSGWTTLSFLGSLTCVATAVAALFRAWRLEAASDVEILGADDADDDDIATVTAVEDYTASDDPAAAYLNGAGQHRGIPLIGHDTTRG